MPYFSKLDGILLRETRYYQSISGLTTLTELSLRPLAMFERAPIYLRDVS